MTDDEIRAAEIILRERSRDPRLITQSLLDVLGDITVMFLDGRKDERRRADIIARIEREQHG